MCVCGQSGGVAKTVPERSGESSLWGQVRLAHVVGLYQSVGQERTGLKSLAEAVFGRVE